MKKLIAFLSIALLAASHTFAGDFPEGSPTFEHKLADALTKAKAANKPIIVIFSAVWCGPCQQMKKKVYPSAEVKPFHDKFIWAYLDADDNANDEDSKKFGVSGIPHIEFLDSTGKSIGKQVGSGSAPDFAKKLEEMLKIAGGKG